MKRFHPWMIPVAALILVVVALFLTGPGTPYAQARGQAQTTVEWLTDGPEPCGVSVFLIKKKNRWTYCAVCRPFGKNEVAMACFQ